MDLIGESKDISIDYDDFYNRLVGLNDPVVVNAFNEFLKVLEKGKKE